MPKDYLAKVPAEHVQFKKITADELAFEFMMNALRLNEGVDAKNYAQHTGLQIEGLEALLTSLRQRKLIVEDKKSYCLYGTRACVFKLGIGRVSLILQSRGAKFL